MNMINCVTLYVDGSCLGNPGPGGWAAILVAETSAGPVVRPHEGSCPATTNNRMELAAVIAGLRALTRPCRVAVVTDSAYVRHALSGGRMKANADLIEELHQAARTHQVEVRQVRAHTGAADADSRFNAEVDRRARAMAERGQ